MKVLLIGPFGEGLLAESYARALERLGHEVFRFDSDEAYLSAAWYAGNRWLRRLGRRALWGRVNEQTVRCVRGVKPALILVFKGAYLNAETVTSLRDGQSAPVVNYYSDNPYCGVSLDPRETSAQRRDLIEVLRRYARVYTWERGLVERLGTDGVRTAYLPFAADTDVYRPAAPEQVVGGDGQHDVVFVGQHDAKRQRHIGMVSRHGVDLWGARWRRAARRFDGRHVIHGEPVSGSACAAVYSSAKVCLNVVNDLNMPGHNMRTFEIPASGGVMVATYTPEQDEFFPEGEAAWYYRSPEELDDVIARLLADEQLRERARRNALQIAKASTYDQRARDLLADLAM